MEKDSQNLSVISYISNNYIRSLLEENLYFANRKSLQFTTHFSVYT